MLLVLTDGFSRFESAGQLCSFCGLTPVIKQSAPVLMVVLGLVK
jgi:hypothetical protein